MKSLDIFGDVVSKTWLKVSISARIHTKERAIALVVMYGNGWNADHAKKDTSWKNRTPQSGQGREM